MSSIPSGVSPLTATYGARLNAYLTNVEDYRKYRSRLNKAIKRLRQDLGIITKDTKKYKTEEFSSENYHENPAVALILLLLAERDNAYALELKSVLEMSKEKSRGNKKVMMTRLKRSVDTSKKVLIVANEESDNLRKIEFYVFAALNHGVYALNKKKWRECVYAMSVARCGLEAVRKENDDDHKKVMAEEVLETVVDPALSMAHSLIGNGGFSDITSVARNQCHDHVIPYLSPAVKLIETVDPSLVAPVHEENFSRLVEWRGHLAHVHSDEVAGRISRMNRENWQSFSEANDFDALQLQWSALVDLHQSEMAKNRDDDDGERVQDDAIVLTYLNYHLHFSKLKRDVLLIDQLSAGAASTTAAKKVSAYKDMLRVYGSALSTTEVLKDLPGVHSDDAVYESLDSLGKFFDAKRSCAVADAYAAAHRFPEALRIYDHVSEKFSGSPEPYAVEFPYAVTTNAEATKFAEAVRHGLARTWTLAHYHRGNDGFVADDVSRFPENPEKIVNVTENVIPVPPKAVLFDVAFNYISYGSDEATKPQDEKKKGFFGIFGR